jgi:cephalosporin-C deacetylase-like acetyl esterase
LLALTGAKIMLRPARHRNTYFMFFYFPNNYTWSSAVYLALMAGGQLGEIDGRLSALRDVEPTPEGWNGAGRRLADRLESDAIADLAKGYSRSAGTRYLRACMYRLHGERQVPPGAEKIETYRVALRSFRRAIEHTPLELERVEIDSPDGSLPAYLIPARTPGKRPIVVSYSGFDVVKELLYAFVRDEFACRGISCLVVDTPGVGEPFRLRNVASRPDYEVPTKAIVDYLEMRSDIDSSRVGLLSISLGGYYAPRGATFEPRIKACVAWGGIWDYGAIWQRRWEERSRSVSVPFFQLPWVMGTSTMDEALERVKQWTLADILPQLKQPFLILHGRRTRRYRSKMLTKRLAPPDQWTKSCASSPARRVERSTLWLMPRVPPYRLSVTGLRRNSRAYAGWLRPKGPEGLVFFAKACMEAGFTMSTKTDVEFKALDGTVLRAWLFKPGEGNSKSPAITMTHGFSATKWHGLERSARAFAEAGFVVLIHDHRAWGNSDGSPRQDIDPWRQIDDWRMAITFLESLDFVDANRVGVWGTSFSGGHAIVLGATDRRVRAVVTQVPTISGWESSLRRIPLNAVAELERAFDDDLRAQFRGAPPRTIKIADADASVHAQYHTQDTVEFLTQPVPEGMWRNELTIQSNRRARMYEPGHWISRVSPTPILVIAATHDTTAPTDLTMAAYERALQPKSIVVLKGGHYSAYLEGFEAASRSAIAFFKQHLYEDEV